VKERLTQASCTDPATNIMGTVKQLTLQHFISQLRDPRRHSLTRLRVQEK
jgi:hypothetical protein